MGLERGIKTSISYAKEKIEDAAGIRAFNRRREEEERDPESLKSGSAYIYGLVHLVQAVMMPLTEKGRPVRPVGYNPNMVFRKLASDPSMQDAESKKYIKDTFSSGRLKVSLADLLIFSGLTFLLSKFTDNALITLVTAKTIHNLGVSIGGDVVNGLKNQHLLFKNKPQSS